MPLSIVLPVVLAAGKSEISAPVVRSNSALFRNSRCGASDRALLFWSIA